MALLFAKSQRQLFSCQDPYDDIPYDKTHSITVTGMALEGVPGHALPLKLYKCLISQNLFRFLPINYI